MKGFIGWNQEELKAYYDTMGFAMSMEDLLFCQEYFRDEEKRDPSVTELRVIDTYWSDHCRHTTFSTRLTEIKVEEASQKAVTDAIEEALKLYFETRDELYGKDTKKACIPDGYGCNRRKVLCANREKFRIWM